jgi:glucokinase
MSDHAASDAPVLVLAFDVGGTHTRARVAAVSGGGEAVLAAPDVSIRLCSAHDLLAFVAQVAATAAGLGTVRAAMVAVAGPVSGTTCRISNWPSDSAISIADLEAAGLPTGHTGMLNDAAVGAWGALSRVDGRAPARAQSITGTAATGPFPAGNLVYVAPGTGLSSATVVRHGLGRLRATVLASEFENTQMPRLGGEIGTVADAIAGVIGREPDWEDLVSGRGLVRIYDALASLTPEGSVGIPVDLPHRAAAIAAAARGGDDVRASAASDVFYRTLGHFAQTLALTCLPCAAVVVGGASTELNLEFVRGSGLPETFRTHHRFGELLSAIPIYAVGGDVNLEGAVRLAHDAL